MYASFKGIGEKSFELARKLCACIQNVSDALGDRQSPQQQLPQPGWKTWRRFGGRSQVNHELLAEGQLPLASGDVQRDRRVVAGMSSMPFQKRRAGLRQRQPGAPREVR